MNCPNCNHLKDDHRARGCYHPDGEETGGICDCALTPDQIELDALKSENARLRAALGEYANPENWGRWYGFADYTMWDWDRSDDNSNGYDLAQKALQGRAE